MTDQDRPRWMLGDDCLPATRPADGIDPHQAIKDALENDPSSFRMSDITYLVESAAAHAVECMQDALLELSRLVKDADEEGVWTRSGSVARHFPLENGSPNSHAMMITHPGRGGAWVVQIDTEDGKTPGSEPKLHRVSAVAINLHVFGRPQGVTSVTTLEALSRVELGKSWCEGQHLNVRPAKRSHSGHLTENFVRTGSSPHIPLRLLSELISDNDLSPLMEKRAKAAGSAAWKIMIDEGKAPLVDAGHAIVHASGGLFDDKVMDHISHFSSHMAAQDLDIFLKRLMRVGREMLAEGYTDAERPFYCNDLRDACHAEEGYRLLSLINRTQNGTFRLDIHLKSSGDIEEVKAYSETLDPPLVGSFVKTEAGLSPKYGREIPYDVRRTQAMSGVISSMSSVWASWEQELNAQPSFS